MTTRSSVTLLNALFDSSFINLAIQNHRNQNQNSAESDSSRFVFEIFINVKTFFCNDIDLEKADHHILNKYVIYRVSQYAFFDIENYDL